MTEEKRRKWVGEALRGDTPKAVVGTFSTALASGIAGAVLSGAWQKVLLGVAALATVLLLGVLVSAALWHSQELGEVNYDNARDEDAENCKLLLFERKVRELIERAAGRAGDFGSRMADISALLELWRDHLSHTQPSSIELVLVRDHDSGEVELVAQAGLFDQANLVESTRLRIWLDSCELEDNAYPAMARARGEAFRLFGVSDSPIKAYAKSQIEHAASHLQSLKMAHAAAGSQGSSLAGAGS